MRSFTSFPKLTGLGLLVSLGLAACTAKENVAPDSAGCAAVATVHFRYGYGAGNASTRSTHDTMLELPDGSWVLPNGAPWTAYQPQQVDGQRLRIGYELGPPPAPTIDCDRTAKLTCLEIIDWCGTPASTGN